jgi:O-antigen/teichoic acid export membrane protein
VAVGGMAMLAIRLAVAPELSRLLAAGRIGAAERIHRQCTVWIVLSSWPIFLFGAVFAPAVLTIFGGGFRRGATALMILALANLVNLAVGNAQTVLLMVGRSSLNMLNTGAALVCQVGLGVALIPHFGVTGAAIGAGAGTVVDNVLSAIQVRRTVGIRTIYPPYIWALFAATACFVGVALTGRALVGTSIVAAVCVGLVCCAAYAVVLGALRRPLTLGRAATIFRRAEPLRQ